MGNFSIHHIYNELSDNLGLELSQFLDIVKMTKEEYYGRHSSSNSFDRLSILSDYLGVSLEKLVQNDIDYKVLRKRFITPSLAISDKYLLSGGSYMDTIRHMLNYCKYRYGDRMFRIVLSQMQLEENVIYNDKVMVNMHFLNDLFSNLEKIGLTKSDVIELAAFVNIKARRSAVLELLKDTKSDFEILDVIVKNQKSYDINFSYKLHSMGSLYCLEAKRNEHDDGEMNEICVDSLCHFKAATIGKAPVLIDKHSLNFISFSSSFEKGRYVQKFIFAERNALLVH